MHHSRLVLTAVLCAFAAPSWGQAFPERPLRIIVAFTSGTAADIVARQLAVKLTDGLGKQVVVENRDGASGTIGAGIAAHATPDGHTMLIASPSIVVSPLLIKGLSYDVFRDFAPVSTIATFPTVLIVGAQMKANTVKELIDHAKANPGKLQAAPEIPALAETLPGYEAASWYGIVVPARTPKPVVARLHAELVKTVQMPDVQQRFLGLRGDIVGGGPDDLGRTMRGGAQKWSKLVREIEAQGR